MSKPLSAAASYLPSRLLHAPFLFVGAILLHTLGFFVLFLLVASTTLPVSVFLPVVNAFER